MGVVVRQKEKGKGKPWWVFIYHDNKRKSIKVGDRITAEGLAARIRMELAQIGPPNQFSTLLKGNKNGRSS